MKLYIKKTVIGVCDEENRDTPLFTRYTLAKFGRFGNLYLHHFHRDDNRSEHHDHPWNFVSVVLWGGYIEHTPDGKARRKLPGMILFRRAKWAHYTTLIGKSAVTLVWVSSRKREWGFHTLLGWIPWQVYHKDHNCD